MKTIKRLIFLYEIRRHSEKNHSFYQYKYDSFFNVLCYKLFKTKPGKYQPGAGWGMCEDILKTAPQSYLISMATFNGYDMISRQIDRSMLKSNEKKCPNTEF